jgi:hypothetical protein
VRKENTAMGTVDKLKDSVDIIEKIKTLPAMESFGEKDLQELLRISKIVRYAPGELIVDESSYDGWIYYLIALAEGVGFEPTELSLNGFQDRRLKPLGHPSTKNGSDF